MTKQQMAETPLVARRELRTLKKYLVELVKANRDVLTAMDRTMKADESYQRGQNIGKCMGALAFATDAADHFGLGKPLKK